MGGGGYCGKDVTDLRGVSDGILNKYGRILSF